MLFRSPAEEAAPAEEAEAEEPLYTRALVGYIDATHDSCLIIHVESRADTPEGCLPEEALTALLEQIVGTVTLEEAK